jgi:putative acetyltransferase
MTGRLRPYEASDQDQIVTAWLAASRVAHSFLSEAFLDQEAKNIRDVYLPNAVTWVYELDGIVVGFISLIENEVGGIFLDPTFHGQGIGRVLMDKAVELCGDLILEVFEQNTIGRRFYKRYGFLEESRSVHVATGQTLIRLTFQA